MDSTACPTPQRPTMTDAQLQSLLAPGYAQSGHHRSRGRRPRKSSSRTFPRSLVEVKINAGYSVDLVVCSMDN
jgi:hypothetical protein